MSIKVCLPIGKGEPKAKQVKLAQKARKPQAAKNGPKKAFPCDQCEQSFNYPSKLKAHIHLGLKPFKCSQCDRAFSQNSHGPAELKRHINIVHLGLKPHKCTQCDEAFGHKGHLNRHIKSAHENAFVFEQCNKKFASKQGMTEHIESVHEGIRHKCDFCDFTSSFRSHLNAHIRKKHQN